MSGSVVLLFATKALQQARVQSISSEFMSAENLIVCTNRTRSLKDLRCDP